MKQDTYEQYDQLFCYRIKPEAQLAFDTDSGQYIHSYTHAQIDGNQKVDRETYLHLQEVMKKGIAYQLGIDKKYLESISQEEYQQIRASKSL